MAEHEATIWCIHGSKTGDTEPLFLKKNHIAIGWARLGDLRELKGDREAFKTRLAARYADKKPGAVLNYSSQLFRFAHEIKSGDIVVYPSPRTHQVHIGQVDGPYKYDPSIQAGYPDLRPVRWLCSLPRTFFSLGALYEIGSPMSFFQIRNFADEFRAALEDKLQGSVGSDETVADVRNTIEETTRDYILRQLVQALKGPALRDFVSHVLGVMGYHVDLSQDSADAGIDLIARQDELGLDRSPLKIQVRSGETNIGDPVVTAFLGKIGDKESGMLVSPGKFAPQAYNLVKNRPNVRLVDGDELVNWILEHYEQIDARYKALFPLKRVYIPDAIETPEQ